MKNSEEIFIKRLEECKKYIDENKEKPTQYNKDKYIKSIANWVMTSQNNYNKYKHNMKDENIRKLWEEFTNDEKYKEYYPSQYDTFVLNLNKLKSYIDKHNQRPNDRSKDKDVKFIASWINNTKRNYSKKIHNMKDENIYKLWNEFINNARYKEYIQLPTMIEKFVLYLNKLKIYIDTYKERPFFECKDKDIKRMAVRINTYKRNYANKECNMKDKTIYTLWTEFINDNKYRKYIQLPNSLEIFNIHLIKLKTYIDTYKERPNDRSKDKDVKIIASWIRTSQNNYSKKINNMKDENIYKLWKDFINDEKYKQYFN